MRSPVLSTSISLSCHRRFSLNHASPLAAFVLMLLVLIAGTGKAWAQTGPNALGRIEAESYDATSGGATLMDGNASGGQIVDYLYNNNWLCYHAVNFGDGVENCTFGMAVDPAYVGQEIELHLDSVTGPRVGNLVAQSTGGFSTYQEQSTLVQGASGVHDLYLVCHGLSGFVNLDYFSFSTSGLKGYWSFNEGAGSYASDSSDYANIGTLTGGTTWTAANGGYDGNALTFNGTGNYVAIPASASLNTHGPLTVSAWVNMADSAMQSDGQYHTIIDHSDGTTDLYLRVYGSSYQFGVSGGGGVSGAISPSDVAHWVHLFGVFDGSSWTLYKNGVQLATAASSAYPVIGNSAWAIGGQTGGGGRYFHGQLDEVMLFSRALSLTEMAGLTDGKYPLGGLIKGVDGAYYGVTSNGGVADLGTVYKIDLYGQVTIIHSFTGGDGASPSGELVVGRDGSLYGVTTSGGQPLSGYYTDGTVYKITAGGQFTLLHTFHISDTVFNDGAYPYGTLIQGLSSAGDTSFYGTTYNGGANNRGAVFKIDLSGSVTVLHSFTGGSGDGGHPSTGLTEDSAGYLYGTTPDPGFTGDPAGPGHAFKLYVDGTSFSDLATFATSYPAATLPRAPLIMAYGNLLYGVSQTGGANNAGALYSLNPTSGAMSVFHSFTVQEAYQPQCPLILGTDNYLYGNSILGQTSTGQPLKGMVYRVNSAGTEQTLYGFTGLDGDTPVGRLLQGSDSTFYGTTRFGGYFGAGVVYELNSFTGELFVMHDFGSLSADGSGTGLTGDYFNGASYVDGGGNDTFVKNRTDGTINYPSGPTVPSGVTASNFCVRWTGYVQPRFTELYTFSTTTTGGVRLWVNGQQLINDWTTHGTTPDSGTISLTEGQRYTIKIEYAQPGSGAITLQWASAHQTQEIVPQSQLYPGLPDLIVSSISWTPASPSSTTPVTFSAVIQNQGMAEAASQIGLSFNTNINGPGQVTSGSYTALGPGNSGSITASGSWTPQPGAHLVTATVDDVNRIPESNELNNALTVPISVSGLTETPSPPPGTSGGLRLSDIVYSPKSLRIDWPSYPHTVHSYMATRGVQSGSGTGATYSTSSNTYWVDAFSYTSGSVYTYHVVDNWTDTGTDPVTHMPVYTSGTDDFGTITVQPEIVTVKDNQTIDSRTDPRYSVVTLKNHRFKTSTFRGGLYAGYNADASNIGRSLLRFVLPPISGVNGPVNVWQVASVNAYYTQCAAAGSTTVGCVVIANAWDADDLTWGTAPTFNASSAPSSQRITLTQTAGVVGSAWVRWPMNDAIYNALTSTGTLSVGLGSITEGSSGWAYFAKKEYNSGEAAVVLYALNPPYTGP